jgi:hypothetical protein
MHKALKIPVTLLVAVAMLAALWLLVFGTAWVIDHVGIYTFCWLSLGIAAGICSWRDARERRKLQPLRDAEWWRLMQRLGRADPNQDKPPDLPTWGARLQGPPYWQKVLFVLALILAAFMIRDNGGIGG